MRPPSASDALRFHQFRNATLDGAKGDPAQWPRWAKALKLVATPEDKGIGDVVVRLIGDENSEAFKAWYKKTFGKDCGCTGRQHRWNRMYPL